MGSEVYANGDAIACKGGDGKVIAAFPDVCQSPPPPPAGPVPVPYPNTSFSKDMQNGSKTVMIKDEEVMLKDQSFYSTSPLGDEAATKGLGGSVVTHVITGKTYFEAWSMDVQLEGQNVDRHSDLTTSNHGSSPGSTPPSPNVDAVAWGQAEDEADECVCCGAKPRHSAGQPMTMDDWYKTGPSGAPSPHAGEYDQLMKDVYNRKTATPPCTCNSQLIPKDPCNVFRRPVTPAEHAQIESAGSGSRFRRLKEDLGLPNEAATTAAFNSPAGQQAISDKYAALGKPSPTPAQMNHERQLERQGNHLVPKTAGGCPTGSNVELQHKLCGQCRALDSRFGDLQDKTAKLT